MLPESQAQLRVAPLLQQPSSAGRLTSQLPETTLSLLSVHSLPASRGKRHGRIYRNEEKRCARYLCRSTAYKAACYRILTAIWEFTELPRKKTGTSHLQDINR